jgi:hypothetical protein
MPNVIIFSLKWISAVLINHSSKGLFEKEGLLISASKVKWFL